MKKIILAAIALFAVVACSGAPNRAADKADDAPGPSFTTQTQAAPVKASDFSMAVKTVSQECFGSAGCVVTYKIKLTLVTQAITKQENSYDLTYKLTGGKEPVIGTLTVQPDGTYLEDTGVVQTTRRTSTLKAAITQVERNGI